MLWLCAPSTILVYHHPNNFRCSCIHHTWSIHEITRSSSCPHLKLYFLWILWARPSHHFPWSTPWSIGHGSEQSLHSISELSSQLARQPQCFFAQNRLLGHFQDQIALLNLKCFKQVLHGVIVVYWILHTVNLSFERYGFLFIHCCYVVLILNDCHVHFLLGFAFGF